MRVYSLWSVAFLFAARAAAQETPAQNLVRIWLDDPLPALEQRVLELGPEAVAPLLARLGIVPKPARAADDDAKPPEPIDAATERRVLVMLARLQQHAGTAFPQLAEAVRKRPVPTRARYYEVLAALAPWRAAKDVLWSGREDHALSDLLEVPNAESEWTSEGVQILQRTAARCWGRPASSLDDLVRLLDSRSPWRVELAIESLAREATTQRERVRATLPRLRAVVNLPDPRLLFTAQRLRLRTSAARLVLALDPEAEDAKALRGVLLGEPAPTPPEAVALPVSASDLRATLAALADEATRASALATLEAVSDDALPVLAAALDDRTPPVAVREALRVLRSRAPRAASALPPLLDAIGKVEAPLQPPLIHTLASLTPWVQDRMPWIHLSRGRTYLVDQQAISMAHDLANSETLRLLCLASIADGACSLEELRDLLTSEDYLQREVGVRIAVARPPEMQRLTKEVLACLDPKRRPEPAAPPLAFFRRNHYQNFDRHLARIAELVLEVADADSALARKAEKLVDPEPQAPPLANGAPNAEDSEPAAAQPVAADPPERTLSPREHECRSLVNRLGTPDGLEPARRRLLELGADAARALTDGLGVDEPEERTVERLQLLRRLGAEAGAEFETLQAAAKRTPRRHPVEFARTIAELAPFRPRLAELDASLPWHVAPSESGADPKATDEQLARIARRASERASTRGVDDVAQHVARLAGRRAFVAEAAVDCLATRGAAAAPAIPALRELLRRSEPRILGTAQTVPLQAKAAAAILAIDPHVPDAADLRARLEGPAVVPAPPPERFLVRVRELLQQLDDDGHREAARENLILLGPRCGRVVAEFAVASASCRTGLEAIGVLLEGPCETTDATTALVEAIATAPPRERLRLLVMITLLAPWSRDVVVPPLTASANGAYWNGIDLMQGLDARARSAIRVVAEELGKALTFDPDAPTDDLVRLLDSDCFPLRLHAMLALRTRPPQFEIAVGMLQKLSETERVYSRFGIWLDPPSVEVLTVRHRRAAAEALLTQVAPDSPAAERARATLERLRTGVRK